AMIALAAFKRAGVTPKGKLVVGALVDEEDAMIGVRHLVKSEAGGERGAPVISEAEENEVSPEQRGVGAARTPARGQMAPGATPAGGVNPIAAFGAILAQAPALEKRIRRQCERSRYLKPPTVTPTIIQGPPRGVGAPQSNVIPALAEITLDVRLTPGIGAEGVQAELDGLCRQAQGQLPGVKLEWQP